MSKSKIHIGIDGNEANVKNRVGSNLYAYSIIKSLCQQYTDTRFTIYLKNPPLGDLPGQSENWSYRVIRPAKLWTQWRLPLSLYLHPSRPDVFYSPGHYAPRKSPIPTVITIMDLAFLKYPNLFLKFKRGTAQLKSWTSYSSKQARHIITISQNTKDDIIEAYGVKRDSITVAYPGIDSNLYTRASTQDIKKLKTKYKLPPKYILYVGTIQPRKNLNRLLKAFETLPRTYKNYQLIISGGKGWMYDEFMQRLERSPRKSQIKLLGFTPKQDLPALYSGAQCTCLVGLYEGFGMPAAESLACGTIPVVSDNSSLPEVVGKAGIKVSPFSTSSIRKGIMYSLKLSPEERKKRRNLGYEHVNKFNWHQSANIIHQTLYDVANKR